MTATQAAQDELRKIEAAIAALRDIPPDDQLAATLAALRDRRDLLLAQLSGSGAIAQGADAKAAGERAVAADEIRDAVVITGDDNIAAGGHVVIAETGATVVIGEAPVKMTAVERKSALGRHLQHVISRNRYLQLQGIRSGGRLVSIELDQIYITLRATRERAVQREDAWLKAEADLAPGELSRLHDQHHITTETVTVSINEALAASPRLVVLGDPGSGKTTLLRYLALLYARDMAEGARSVHDKLGLLESGRLPILLPLRQIGKFLSLRPDEGTEGHALLLEFLLTALAGERIDVPQDFFDDYLKNGRAVILLDGLDEVADPDLRRRVARLVESFTAAYPDCRYVVTSRIVGYTGTSRLGENYATNTVRDFSLADVENFLTHWHRLIAVGQMGPGESADHYAADQTQQLLSAIKSSDRIRELAINPLMLTVIAMVHRDRVKLPDRRAELYAEAIDVLLGKWEEAKGLHEIAILDDKPFDTGDRRLMLQNVALRMHERELKEIEAAELRRWLGDMFEEFLHDPHAAERAVERFLHVIEERTGILAARGEGVYAFSHLTFQEYLAALAAAARDDYIAYTLQRVPKDWWREVILLEAGHLSMQSKERTTRLIQSIMDFKEEASLYHNLVLAAECVRDVGSNRILGDLENDIQSRLHAELDTPPPRGPLGSVQVFLTKGISAKSLAQRRVAAAEALAHVGGRVYWSLPHGEPEWVTIPEGEFWMGDDESGEAHRVYLNRFAIARVPITNSQYHLFVQATQHRAPEDWAEGRPPKSKQGHPVVNVSWHDAMAYCNWLGDVIGKAVTLPSEAEWEKAARGDADKRVYPWGDVFEATRCNSAELSLGETSPVGIFLNGASPYGVLDMSGNVWEWTRSIYRKYPYVPTDGREELSSDDGRVLRGGAFFNEVRLVRCAVRDGGYAVFGFRNLGFRVVVSPL